MIDSFQGSYRFLSNFYDAEVELDGVVYRSTERAYQAAKTFNLQEREAIRLAETDGRAKRLGQKVTLRPDFEQVKVSIMLDLVRQKFTKHPDLTKALLATGDVELVEGNTWGDTFWGVCNGVGQNWLGLCLMMVRNEIRAARDAALEDGSSINT